MANGRNSKGQFVKGSKAAGRPKGVKDKIPRDAREMVKRLLDESFPLVLRDMHQLKARDRARLFVALLPYVVPRLASVEAAFDIARMSDAQVDDIFYKVMGALEQKNNGHER